MAERAAAVSWPRWEYVTTPFNPLDAFASASFLPVTYTPPAGNGLLMASSFAPFKPKVRTNWDGTTFFIEGDNMPDGMPNRMAGITTWQQQVPLPVAYFAGTTNPENAAGSLGYKQPNYWRLPLVPTVAPSPTLIFTPGSTTNNFQRGAIAIASNGVAIFNPANNTGHVSYEIGELDYYGGHSGMADDYHYHIIPTHLSSRYGGPLSDDKPLAWALDGYPIYGYVEPDGSARQALDSNGGHDIGNGWGYHYHAIGTTTRDATHPYGTPQSPYTMTSFRGTVVNFGGQVDGQPEVSAIRADGTGGYNAKPISGAYIVAFMNPAPLVTDGSGNLNLPAGVNLTGCSTTFDSATVNCASTAGLAQGMAIVGLGVANNATVTQVNSATQFTISTPALATTTGRNFSAVSLSAASADNYVMRVNMGGTDYDECWKINRGVNPRTLTMTWRAQALISGQLSGPVVTTTSTYTPNSNNPAAVNRLTAYTMSGPSQLAIPDTGQTIDTTATFGEDSDYAIHPQQFTDNGNGTITDNVTGLMWQKVDNGESTWETAVANAASVNTGGHTDWRLPTPSELFSVFNHNSANPALNTTFFPNNPGGAAEYWWTSDIFGASTTQAWCANSGGGLGPKPKAETISAGGAFRYHARYVRGAKPTNTHNYQNNGDGTVTDLDTGLMWTQIPGPAVTWDAALSYTEGLSTGGFNDWRLPNVKELQTLTDYSLATATGAGTALKPSMNQTMFAKTLTNCTTTAGGTTITCADTTGLLPGMPLVDDSSSNIAGAYIPYATPPTVSTVMNATTFTVNSGTGINAGSGLTLKALPPPTAFWSSTSQNNVTANAWVVEFGTNNSSSPARNSQGIISQNVKTAAYPVFAVRTTSVATQIAVAQGANTLTDGVSTVGYTASGSKPFTITNTGVTSLTFNSVTIDGANSANFTLSGAPVNGTVIPPNGTATFSVSFNATSAATYSASLRIDSSDTAVGAAFDVNLTGTIPVIANVAVSPATPTNADTPFVSAKVTPIAGRTISQVQLTYNVGSQTTNTVFNETMAASATVTNPWDGVGVYNWTVTTQAGAGNITQNTAANHTPNGQGNPCGLQFSKGSATATQTMVTTTNAINTTGLSGYVEFYTRNVNVAAGLGWILQVSPDGGTTWNTRASGLTGTAESSFQYNRYDFVGGATGASELTGNLKLRFQFIGNGTGGSGATKTFIDDVVIKTVTGNPPVTVTMFDDGLHGDGAAGDGIYGVQLPAFNAGTNVTFSVTATDSTSVVTTLAGAGSYITTLPLSITTTSPLPGALTSAPYNQALAATGGTGPYTWSVTAGTLPPGITLGANGAFSGTGTSAGTANFTATVTDSVGHSASQAFSLSVKVPPNIVIVVTDDQGWADVGYHTAPGQVPIQTPTMDSFGTTRAGSIRMEKFYATTVCSVTRSTLLTGRNAIRTGVNNERGLDLSEHIMPQTFNTAGYQSYMVGKWHLGGSDKNQSFTTVNGVNTRIIQEGTEYAPHNRGWLSHYGQYSGAIDYFTHQSAETLSEDHPDWWLNGVQQDGPSEHTDSQGHGGWAPDLLADKAIAHIQKRDPNKPLLLYVAFNSIHGPVSAPAPLISKYQSLGVTDPQRRLICAAVDGMDAAMGRVLAALDTAGITNNTLVVWFSDNGGDLTKGSLNSPLRGDKGDSYEGGMHMPAGVCWPGVLPSGVTSNQYMWVGDVFPTICSAAGVTPQNTKPLDGVDLWPSLLAANSNATTTLRPGNKTLVTVSAAPIAINRFTDPVNGGNKDFKLIRTRVGASTVNELFNLTDDPYETTELSANSAYAAIVASLTADITAITAEDYKPYVGPPLIANTVAQGTNITLYAPFTSYKTPTVQWRKNGVAISGATSFTQVTDPTSALVTGAYTTTFTLSNAAPADAGSYDVVITNVAGSTTSAPGAVAVVVGAPALTTLPTFTKGTSQTVSWSAVPTATSYTVQTASDVNFTNIVGARTSSTTSATFAGLASGTQYWFRATATDGVTTSDFSGVVTSTQDAGNPTIAISSPVNGSVTTATSIVVSGTAGDAISGVASVTVNGVAATTSDDYAHWSATVPLNVGLNAINATALDNAQSGGNSSTTSISATLAPNAAVIANITMGPASPTYLDNVWVTALVQTAPLAPVSTVQLTYNVGTPISTTVFREVFSNTSANNWSSGGASANLGAQNQWITPGTTQVRQAIGTSNNTTPIVLTNCTLSGSSVTCSSTASLWPGMLVTGPNIPGATNGNTSGTGSTKISAITSATTFTLSQSASANAGGVTLTVAGVTLTNCATTSASPFTVTCDSTAGLVNGMALTGTGLANNATVASVTDATHFNMSAAPTTPGSGLTLSASGAAAEFQVGTAASASFETSAAISTAGVNSGYVEFHVQTRDLASSNNCGWALQVWNSTDNTWTTRVSEDWNTKTVNLTNCVLNTAGSLSGSTTVTCTSTAGLTTGRVVAGQNVYVTGTASPTSAVITGTDTTNLKAGMFVSGSAGIPNGARILTIDSGTQFTMNVNSTVVSATTVNFAAAHFAANATVSSITNATTFVLNTPAYVNTTASPIGATATTLNHGFQLFHYDLSGNELNGSIKLRFTSTGYAPATPARVPRVDIDDITVATTTLPPPLTITMHDDGLHGDGAAGDHIYGAQIPAQAGGTSVGYFLTATDINSNVTTSGSSSFTVNTGLTDATFGNSEFLSIPTDTGVTLTAVPLSDQDAYIEYGTVSGSYTAATSATAFPVATGPVRIALTGLQPDTKYFYRLRHRATGTTPFSARGERSFRTARARGSSFTFTITADPHLDFNTDATLLTRAMVNLTLDQPDFHVDLGDIFMTDKMADTVAGVPAAWGGGPLSQSQVNLRALIFRNYFELACHSIPYFFTLGNHEAEYGYIFAAAADKQNNVPAWNLKARKAYFPAPQPNSFYSGNGTPMDYAGGTLGLLENYYAWEWGDALFVVLDPFWNTMTNPNSANDAWHWTLGKTQYDWLKTTLQNSSAKYKFVFMHHIVGGTTTLADGTTPQFAARGGVESADKFEWGGKNTDGTDGFASHRPGWDMPIHQLLAANKVNAVFHGHDHFYGYQTLDGIVYLECPQPGTANYVTLGSAADGKYTQGVLLPNSGHIRVTVTPGQALAEYVRAYRPQDENATTHNRDVSHSFTMQPRVYALVEIAEKAAGSVSFRWNAVPNKAYAVQWSPDLVNWTTIDTVTFPSVQTNGGYTDTNAARVGEAKGFYRVSYTP